MIPEGTEARAVSEEQIRQVAADVDLHCKAYSLSRADVARAIGYDSPGVISEFVNGKYKGNNAQLAIDLEAWLVEDEPRRAQPATTQFVWTNLALEIKGVANYCMDKRRVGLIYGPDTTGIGKTTALKAIHQELGPRRCSLVTVDKVDASKTGIIRKLCRAMHVNDSGCTADRFRRLQDKLTGRSHLLIIDQIHNLRRSRNDEPFYVLMDLFEATRTAQLWCGTADLVAYLERQRRKAGDESLAQVRSRIFPVVDLMGSLAAGGGADGGGGGELLVTVDQVREMFAANKLKLAPAAARFLCELCNQPDSGSVRLCVELVEYATMMVDIMPPGRRPTSIDLPLIKQAMGRGFTPARAGDLLRRMEERQQQQQAAPAARAG